MARARRHDRRHQLHHHYRPLLHRRRGILPGGFTRYKGFIFPHKYYSAAGDLTYEQVIDAFCTEWGKTAVYKDDTEAWLDYQFLPDGQVIILNSAMRFLNQLQQKRLITACDNGSEEIRFYSADVLGSSVATFTLKDQFSIFTTKTRRRQYIWRDEDADRALRRHRYRPTPQPGLSRKHRQPTGTQHADVPSPRHPPPRPPHTGRRYHHIQL